jgi:hypothetical protein
VKPIYLDEMRERVGRAIFHEDWFGGVSDEDWALITGPFGIKQRVRASAAAVNPSEIAPCPRRVANKLDRAIGRAARCDAQYSTVDTWLEDHGVSIDPTKPADRASFNAIMRKELAAKPAVPPARRGTKPKVLPRLLKAIAIDIAEGRLTLDQLRELRLKDLAPRYDAKPSSARDARILFLKHQTTPKKKK